MSADDLGFDDWINQYSDPEPEQELHEYMMQNMRTRGTHLGVPSESGLRPPVGRTIQIDFGAEDTSGPKETKTEYGTKFEQLHFEKIPRSVIERFENSQSLPEIKQIESVVGDEQAEQRKVPVYTLCTGYFGLVQRWISEVGPAAGIIDTIDGEVAEVEWDITR